MNIQTTRSNLDEISFIRPILIILLVFYHSMCIHTGNWESINGVNIIKVYKDMGNLSYSFMLESFVFMSGYVWAYQHLKRGKESIYTLCKKKVLRLLLPSFIFGILYFLIFSGVNFCISDIGEIIEGPGHLWFLPMLFWCFVIGYGILHLNYSYRIIIPILFLVCIFRPIGLPMRLSHTLYYLPFFFLGYYFFGGYEKVKLHLKQKHIVYLWVLFLASYIVLRLVEGQLTKYNFWGAEICTLVYATIGTFAFLFTAIIVTKHRKLKSWYVKLGSLCMGVYIFQQFILQILYYHTDLPLRVNVYILPFIGFGISLIVSLILSFLIRQIKWGKYII